MAATVARRSTPYGRRSPAARVGRRSGLLAPSARKPAGSGAADHRDAEGQPQPCAGAACRDASPHDVGEIRGRRRPARSLAAESHLGPSAPRAIVGDGNLRSAIKAAQDLHIWSVIGAESLPDRERTALLLTNAGWSGPELFFDPPNHGRRGFLTYVASRHTRTAIKAAQA
jgi:hypothetical protein